MYSSIIAVHTEIRQNTAHTSLQCFAQKYKSNIIDQLLPPLRQQALLEYCVLFCFLHIEGAFFTSYEVYHAQGAHAAKTQERRGAGGEFSS